LLQSCILHNLLACCATERAPPIIPRRPTAQPEPQIHSDSDNSSGSDDDAALPQTNDDKIILKMQSKDGNVSSLRIGKQMALSKLFEMYKKLAIQKGWLPPEKASAVSFMFDGDSLDGNETVEGLDCDNGDIIEVKW